MTAYRYYIDIVRRAAAFALAIAAVGCARCALAAPLHSARNDAFYAQLMKLPDHHGYLPTRSFTIVVDPAHGNRLVAEDDPNLRFNLLWMERFQPGYHESHGGSAFSELIRSCLRMIYKTYRNDDPQAFADLPDENGLIRGHRNAPNLAEAMDYDFKLTGNTLRFGMRYRF